MKKINFEAGTQVSPAKVTIDNIDHEVTPAVWEGNTPLSPFVLNKMQDNIEEETKTTQTTEVSEELTINNCAGVKGKLDIKSGKSEQATRSGKNKLKLENFIDRTTDGVTFTAKYDTNGGLEYINAKGNSTTGYRDIVRVDISSLPAGNYIINGLGTNKVIRYVLLKQGDTDAKIINTNTDVAFTQDSSLPYVAFRIDLYQAGEIDCQIKPMIRLSTETDNTYEPYGVMPSPDYPSRIRNVGDNIQLFDKDSTNIENGYLNSNGIVVSSSVYKVSDFIKVLNIKKITISGNYGGSEIICFYDNNKTFLSNVNMGTNTIKTFEVPSKAYYVRTTLHNTVLNFYKIQEGSIPTIYTPYNCGSTDFKVENRNLFNGIFLNGSISTTTGLFYASSNSVATQDFIKVLANKTIYFSNNGAPTSVNIFQYQLDGTFIAKVATANSYTFTEDCLIKFTRGNTSIDKFQVEYDERTNYLEHKEYMKSFPFTEGQVLHLNDYLASDGIHQKRKTLVLDGTEGWGYTASTKTFWLNIASGYIKNTSCISSHFKYNGINTSIDNSIYIGTNALCIVCNRFTTIEDFKAYLAEQYANGTPVTVEYDLAQEIVIPYTPEQEEAYYELQHLLMYEGYTNISCIDEIKPDIQGTYYFNNELNNSYGERFDKVEDSINELENKHIYSTEEKVVGRWIDGKPLYSKVIDIGELPNATTKNVAFNISNLKNIIKIEGYARGSNYWLPIPYSNNITIMCNSLVIGITTTTDRSSCTGYVTLYYTKTTD